MDEGGGAMDRVLDAVGVVLVRLRWLPVVLQVLLPVAAGVLLSRSGGATTTAERVALGAGVALLLANAMIALAVGWWERQDRRAQVAEADRLRVAMKDALQPLAQVVAAMPYATAARREALTREAALTAVGGLLVLLRGVEGLRAVVFALTPDGRTMEPLAHLGRGTPPNPFVAGTPRGDRALEVVRADVPVFVRDLAVERPEAWEGSGADYRTFISVSISTGEYAYGMLTVDAPRAGSLALVDVDVLRVVSYLLAIAFASADAEAA